MKNTKNITIENLKVLVYGGMGTGKTMFAGTFPSPVMLDFDRGALSLKSAGINVDYEDFAGEDYNHAKVMKFIKEHTTSGKYKTIVLDSLTTLANNAMTYTLKMNGRSDQRPTQADYLDQMRYIEEVVVAMVSSPINCLVIAHVQADKDELTGRIEAGILVTGKLSKRIPTYFDEIYYSEKLIAGKETSYQLRTKHSGQYPARSRLDFQEHIIPDFKEIEKKLKGGEREG